MKKTIAITLSAAMLMASCGRTEARTARGTSARIIVRSHPHTVLTTIARATAGNSPENRYIQSMKLNGKTYTKGYIRHEDIVGGGILEIKMGREPVKWY